MGRLHSSVPSRQRLLLPGFPVRTVPCSCSFTLPTSCPCYRNFPGAFLGLSLPPCVCPSIGFAHVSPLVGCGCRIIQPLAQTLAYDRCLMKVYGRKRARRTMCAKPFTLRKHMSPEEETRPNPTCLPLQLLTKGWGHSKELASVFQPNSTYHNFLLYLC